MSVIATTAQRGLKMTRTTKLLLTTGALALGATAFAGASLADGGWGRHHGHGHHRGAGEGLFETFDANQDGRLTQAEIDQARQAKLTEFDRDGDGSLTLEEYQALWLDAMRERMVDNFQDHDDDGDGMVTAEEFGERYSGIVSRVDEDGDGAVTMDEMRQRMERRHRGGDRGRPEGGRD
jgi:Ca2+-binding EF-hand superfamily protein